MKTQRRHELQHNELADWLGTYVTKFLPFAKVGLAVLIGGVVVAGVMMYLNAQRRSKIATGWAAFGRALGDADQLRQVAERYPQSPAGLWATEMVANTDLAEGKSELFVSRGAAKERLELAKEGYEKILRESRDPLALLRARFGLAKVHESRSGVGLKDYQPEDELKLAKELYAQVNTADPEGALGKAAKKRMEYLSTDAAEEWYRWFARQEPKLPTGPFNDPLGAGGGLQGLPDRPAKFPDLGSESGLLKDEEEASPPEDASPDSTSADEEAAPEGASQPSASEDSGPDDSGASDSGADDSGADDSGADRDKSNADGPSP